MCGWIGCGCSQGDDVDVGRRPAKRTIIGAVVVPLNKHTDRTRAIGRERERESGERVEREGGRAASTNAGGSGQISPEI